MDDIADRPLMRHASLDALGDSFSVLVTSSWK